MALVRLGRACEGRINAERDFLWLARRDVAVVACLEVSPGSGAFAGQQLQTLPQWQLLLLLLLLLQSVGGVGHAAVPESAENAKTALLS